MKDDTLQHPTETAEEEGTTSAEVFRGWSEPEKGTLTCWVLCVCAVIELSGGGPPQLCLSVVNAAGLWLVGLSTNE